MSDTQTVDNAQNPVPTVQQFVSPVKEQLTEWGASTVEGLCESQTQSVIDDLAPYYHGDQGEYIVPTVGTFKQVFRDFQEKKDRDTFADLTDPEVLELITLLEPNFRTPAEVTQG